MRAKIVGGFIAIILTVPRAFAQAPASAPPPPVIIFSLPEPVVELPLPSKRATPPTAADIAKGEAIAKILNGEKLTMVATNKIYGEALPKIIASNTDLAAIEKELPGYIQAMIAAIWPILQSHTAKRLPDLWKQLGAVYSGAMTSTELDRTLVMYRSPAGTKLLAATVANVDFGPVLQRIIDSGNSNFAASDLSRANLRATAGAAKTLNKTDEDYLNRFANSSAGRKIRQIGPALNQVVTSWTNIPDPELNAETAAAIKAAADDYVQKARK